MQPWHEQPGLPDWVGNLAQSGNAACGSYTVVIRVIVWSGHTSRWRHTCRGVDPGAPFKGNTTNRVSIQ